MNVLRKYLHKLKLRLRALAGKDPEAFFWNCHGIIHVGANTGQEAEFYHDRGLSVLWIEPIDELFDLLTWKIAGYPKQKAVKALVTDKSKQEYDFHVANNNGGSSSIFEFAEHKDIWPEVGFEKTVRLQSATLPEVLSAHNLESRCYDCLVIDTQGSELLVLKGAEKLLAGFKFIKAEAADFEAYRGCARYADMVDYLFQLGFVVHICRELARAPSGGKYYEVVFRRNDGNTRGN